MHFRCGVAKIKTPKKEGGGRRKEKEEKLEKLNEA